MEEAPKREAGAGFNRSHPGQTKKHSGNPGQLFGGGRWSAYPGQTIKHLGGNTLTCTSNKRGKQVARLVASLQGAAGFKTQTTRTVQLRGNVLAIHQDPQQLENALATLHC